MIEFVLALTLGMFLIPTIKEIKYTIFFFGGKNIIKEPLEFIKGIIDRTFKGGY